MNPFYQLVSGALFYCLYVYLLTKVITVLSKNTHYHLCKILLDHFKLCSPGTIRRPPACYRKHYLSYLDNVQLGHFNFTQNNIKCLVEQFEITLFFLLQFHRKFSTILAAEHIGGLTLKNISTSFLNWHQSLLQPFFNQLTSLTLVNCSITSRDSFHFLRQTNSLKSLGLVNCRELFISGVLHNQKSIAFSIVLYCKFSYVRF